MGSCKKQKVFSYPEWDRIQREKVRYIEFTQMASASVKRVTVHLKQRIK
jgi:hypothetical protein